MQRKFALAAVLAAGLIAPAAAGAHVTVTPAELPAEGFGKVDFSVPHGCDGSPTTSLTIQLPDSVVSATPQEVAGWDIEIKEGKLAQPYESHGETLTRGPREITWTGGPLPDPHLQVFGLSVQTGNARAGDTAAFKAIQKCEKGETAWVEITEEGEEEPEHPAPFVTLAAAEEEHGGGSAASEEEPAAAASASSGDDGPSTGLVIVALILGGLGLVTGVAGLMAARRASTA